MPQPRLSLLWVVFLLPLRHSASAEKAAVFSDPPKSLLECGDAPGLKDYIERERAEAAGGNFTKWQPTKGKYLFLHCVRGQISNRVRCIHYHMILAGLLQRVLLVPMQAQEVLARYDLRMVFDVIHARHCFGYALHTTAEYMRKHKERPEVDRIHCWRGPKGLCGGTQEEDLNCPLVERQSQFIAPTGIHRAAGHVEAAWTRFKGQRVRFAEGLPLGAACLPLKVTKEQLLEAFDTPEIRESRTLVVGDLVEVDILPAEWTGPDPPIVDKTGRAIASAAWKDLPFFRKSYCPSPLAVKPDGALLQAAKEFAEEQFQGRPYLAVHWRRGDFRSYCLWHGPPVACYFPPKQVAACIGEAMERLGIWDLYLTTNGKTAELEELLSSLGRFTKDKARVVRLPTLDRSIAWMEPIYKRRMDQHMGLVKVMMEKLVCAQSTVFLGSVASTFSQDIQRIRNGLQQFSCHDSTLCLGQKEWIRNRG